MIRNVLALFSGSPRERSRRSRGAMAEGSGRIARPLPSFSFRRAEGPPALLLRELLVDPVGVRLRRRSATRGTSSRRATWRRTVRNRRFDLLERLPLFHHRLDLRVLVLDHLQ